MKVLITAGGTREYIDSVRVMTNISTGKLGAKIADTFGYSDDIYYIHGKDAMIPTFARTKVQVIKVEDAYRVLESLVPNVDIVIHSMAVSDFTFKKNQTKLKSNSKEDFIKYLEENIEYTPKIISKFREWNERAKLIGFKFEVGLKTDELIEAGYRSLVDNKLDYVVANDKSEMERVGEHVAYIINKDKKYEQCIGKEHIAYRIRALFY